MAEVQRKTLVQRITQLLARGPATPEPVLVPAAVKPAESEEQKRKRLEAYRSMCEQEGQAETNRGEKPVKYRSDARSSSVAQ